MSTVGELIAGIGITTYASGLAAGGWTIRTNLKWRSEIRNTLQTLDSHLLRTTDRSLAIERSIKSLNRTVPALREAVTVLTSELEAVTSDVRDLTRQVDRIRDRLPVSSTTDES